MGGGQVLLLHCATKYEDPDTDRWGYRAAELLGAELKVIADGRDPWEVFRDERYLGNTRVDPCSKILKRQLADRWMVEHYEPSQCVRYVGYHWSEMDRLEGIKARLEPKGWKVEAPMCEAPFVAYSKLQEEAVADGLWVQQLYKDGFPHANCGGRCVKQGQAGWKRLLETHPDRYAECEGKEEEMRQMLGKDVAMMRDRRNKKLLPLTLRRFREELEAGGQCDLFDWGGCGCFSGGEEGLTCPVTTAASATSRGRC